MRVRNIAPQMIQPTKVLKEQLGTSKGEVTSQAQFDEGIKALEAQAYVNLQAISFGYKSILKTYWLKGLMPSVKFDMGGNLLTKKNCTLGHMLPHSKGGHTSLYNLMLETKGYNMSKGNFPFSKFFNKEAFEEYCKQFEDIKLPGFDGKDYIEKITKTAKRLIRERR